MARDLNALWDWIPKLVRRIERLESGALLENSSITGGRMRFIGGLLRIDSGGRVEIVGTLQIDGTTTVTGTFTVTGNFKVTGPWRLEGPGDITGNVDVTGTIRVLAGGKIQVGNIIIDPTISGGAITFANGAQVFTDGSTIQVYKGNGVVQISDTEAKLQLGGTVLRLTSGHIYATGMSTRDASSWPGGFVGAVVSNGTELFRLI
ncbi:hypothetical protein AB0300_18275 [Microbacterium sp. NPDC078814]|uniref:hypothetical protein n=1 Tax=Microbacterium sp. NPDC078814 TaxID=3154767 RepID=UPI00344C17AA